MGAHHFHPPGHGHSALHRAPAGLKLAGALALVLTVVLLPRSQVTGLLMVAVILAGLFVVSRIQPTPMPTWGLRFISDAGRGKARWSTCTRRWRGKPVSLTT